MEQLSVTLIQSSLVWENPGQNRNAFEQKIKNIHQKTHIVVLPEMFTTGFTTQSIHLAETMDGETLQWMKKTAASKKIILTGSIIIKEDENYYNRMIWMQPNGVFGYYDKRHLFNDEQQYFSSGSKRCIARVGGWRVQLQICYDLRFPVWTRQQSKDDDYEYDVLMNAANWPASRNETWQTLLKARAIENQCYVVGVNRIGTDGNNIHYCGNSMAINPLGNIIENVSDTDSITTVVLQKADLHTIRNQFPFGKDSDAFAIY